MLQVVISEVYETTHIQITIEPHTPSQYEAKIRSTHTIDRKGPAFITENNRALAFLALPTGTYLLVTYTTKQRLARFHTIQFNVPPTNCGSSRHH